MRLLCPVILTVRGVSLLLVEPAHGLKLTWQYPPAAYLDEDFVNVERIAVASILSFQATSIDCSEFDAPQTDGFTADGNASLS